jgi:RNA polymerase sigma-70 factor (ECF subfamily)
VAWAIFIAKGRIIDYYRQRSAERVVFSDTLLDRLAQTHIDFFHEHDDRRDALQHCLKVLSSGSRRVLDMRYVQGMRPTEIALELDRSPGSVRVSLQRMREELMKCITRRLGAQGA